MKRRVLFFGSIILLFSLRITAQVAPSATPQNKTPESAQTVDPQGADVSITANVTIKELKFEAVPNPTVTFFGKPERNSVWEADRQNLPKPAEPGVTYRNVGIQLRIASRFADIDRIVAEALGEVPVADETAKPSTAIKPVTIASTLSAQTKNSAGARRKPSILKRRNK